jgi:hypothetical protein
MYCSVCKKECGVEKTDMSFDHEFGTKVEYSFGSDCCNGDVYKYLCEDCNGAGCENCDNLGVYQVISWEDYDER